MVSLTPKQVEAIQSRITDRCTNVEVRRWDTVGRTIEVNQFERQRLIESVKIAPGGTIKVLS